MSQKMKQNDEDPRYDVITEVDAGQGVISQQLELVENDLRQIVFTRIMRTQEKGIRDALLYLGWTPPPDGFIPIKFG